MAVTHVSFVADEQSLQQAIAKCQSKQKVESCFNCHIQSYCGFWGL